MEKVRIEIEGMRLRARHGVMKQERTVGNEFIVDLAVECDAEAAVAADSLDGTINYAELCDVVKEVMATPSALLEHVCGRIRSAVMERFPSVQSGRVRIAKVAPPIPNVALKSVAVTLQW